MWKYSFLLKRNSSSQFYIWNSPTFWEIEVAFSQKFFGFLIHKWVKKVNGSKKVLTLTPVVLQTNIDENLTRINDQSYNYWSISSC